VEDREAEEDENGVDLTLVDVFLAMTVEERLRVNDRMARAVLLLRRSFSGQDE